MSFRMQKAIYRQSNALKNTTLHMNDFVSCTYLQHS